MANCHVVARPEAVPSGAVGAGAHVSTVWARPLAVGAYVLGVVCSPLGQGLPMAAGEARPSIPHVCALPVSRGWIPFLCPSPRAWVWAGWEGYSV